MEIESLEVVPKQTKVKPSVISIFLCLPATRPDTAHFIFGGWHSTAVFFCVKRGWWEVCYLCLSSIVQARSKPRHKIVHSCVLLKLQYSIIFYLKQCVHIYSPDETRLFVQIKIVKMQITSSHYYHQEFLNFVIIILCRSGCARLEFVFLSPNSSTLYIT